MSTVTVKGQVTIPKAVRDAAGIKPGDEVVVRATASGGVYIEKPGAANGYAERIREVARRYPIVTDQSTDAIMREMRGDPDDDYK